MKTNKQAGYVLVESAVFLSSFIFISTAILLITLSLGGRTLMMIESYSILRANLYQNVTSCEANKKLWPALHSLRIKYFCPHKNVIHAEMQFLERPIYTKQFRLGGNFL